jgi:hypothetical protein
MLIAIISLVVDFLMKHQVATITQLLADVVIPQLVEHLSSVVEN